STRRDGSTRRPTPTSTAACTSCRSGPPTPSKARAPRWRASGGGPARGGGACAKAIVFTRGTTEAVNLVAGSFGRSNVQAGDEVLITALEHHSNIVPWQMLCEEKEARLRVAPIDDRGDVVLEAFED